MAQSIVNFRPKGVDMKTMDLSSHVLDALQLAGDSSTLPDKLFSLLIEGLFDVLLQRSSEAEALGAASAISPALLKQCYYGLTAFVVDAAKLNSDRSSISAVLEECKWLSDRIDFLCRKFEECKSDMQIILARIGHSYPHLVDVDWRLDYCIKNNVLEKVNEASYLISLKTEKPGEQGSIQFSCTAEQLQDLLGKLKDASKSLEKATHA